jgi:hypothetical protein
MRIIRDLGDGDLWKKPEVKNLLTLSLYLSTMAVDSEMKSNTVREMHCLVKHFESRYQ